MKKVLFDNEKGQAIFELIIFMPFLLMLYSIVTTISASINGSINQQKIVRGYFYSSARGNSMIPIVRQLEKMRDSGATNMGTSTTGWADKIEEEKPLAPCYKLSTLLKSDEACESPVTGNETQFVRVFTVYGICGASYMTRESSIVFDDLNKGQSACTIQ